MNGNTDTEGASSGEGRAGADADADWNKRNLALWAAIDEHEPAAFVASIDAMADELPQDDPVGLFERGSALDSTGHPELAIPLYRAALAAGLGGLRRRRATIQMASSLRNLGHADESVALLRVELDAGSDELDAAVRGFLALALADTGREREGLALALTALAASLPRYNRSLAHYAEALLPGTTTPSTQPVSSP